MDLLDSWYNSNSNFTIYSVDLPLLENMQNEQEGLVIPVTYKPLEHSSTLK